MCFHVSVLAVKSCAIFDRQGGFIGLEQDGHEGWNSYDFALKSNSTACKILPVRLNATFYYPGSGTNA